MSLGVGAALRRDSEARVARPRGVKPLLHLNSMPGDLLLEKPRSSRAVLLQLPCRLIPIALCFYPFLKCRWRACLVTWRDERATYTVHKQRAIGISRIDAIEGGAG